MTEQFGDKRVVPFSFETDPESVQKEQVSCWLTYTNEDTHKIIKIILTVHLFIQEIYREQVLDTVHLLKTR